MIAHAFAADHVDSLRPTDPDDGLLVVEDSADWRYVLDSNPDAEAAISAKYDTWAGQPWIAARQFVVEIPAHIDLADLEAVHEFVSDLEWDEDWVGATIVRQNELGAQLTAAIDARRTAHAGL